MGVTFKTFSQDPSPVATVSPEDQLPLPPPFDRPEDDPWFKLLTVDAQEQCVCLDDTIALNIPKPKTVEEEDHLVNAFLSGLRKLFSADNNWTFLQPLLLSIEHCTRCLTCSSACPVFEESGHNELYRPALRSEILRRIYFKYVKGASVYVHGDTDLNWMTVTRLLELAYRCNLCRRCAQSCPLGLDNGLLCREIRKIGSQEMGIHPKELHDNGSVLQLRVGSSTGMSPEIFKDNLQFIDEDTSEKTGIKVVTPVDKQGADILLIHNAGEIMAWPENIGAFSLLFNQAGLNWTVCSDIPGYDGINYGVFYDDAQFARVALRHARVAQKLGVRRIVLGECGHAHKALAVIADNILSSKANIPRESSIPLLRDIALSGCLQFDKDRNCFPVSLHDPCSYVRMMGIVSPQRQVLNHVVPSGRFREMHPHGVNNYCCGGGSGFALMSGHNFAGWRHRLTGRRKFRQILQAFQGEPWGAEHHKYVCAPCSNCKGQLRDIFGFYQAPQKAGLHYGGLVELMVNALVGAKPKYIDWEWH